MELIIMKKFIQALILTAIFILTCLLVGILAIIAKVLILSEIFALQVATYIFAFLIIFGVAYWIVKSESEE
jgi:hypothetical protein